MKFEIEILIDDGTGEPYEQLKIGDDDMNDTCEFCNQKVDQPSIMQFNYMTYKGHLSCMKLLRKKLETECGIDEQVSLT